MSTRQDQAIALTMSARTLAEFDRAHVAMRKAWPKLARTYPCFCAPCLREARKRGRRGGS